MELDGTNSGDQQFLTPAEAHEHAFHGRSYHPDGVSVTTDKGIAEGFGSDVVTYELPQSVFDRLPHGDPTLGERVLKNNIPDEYRKEE